MSILRKTLVSVFFSYINIQKEHNIIIVKERFEDFNIECDTKRFVSKFER